MTASTWDAIAVEVYRVGLRGEPAAIAVAITQPESGRDPSKHNLNAKTRDDSWGWWQINMTAEAGGPGRLKALGLTSKSQLLDPYTNARAMALVSSGGSNFGPWTGSFKKGLHKPYLTEARRAVQAVEARSGGPSTVGGSSSSTTDAPPVRSEDVYGAIASLRFNNGYVPSRFIDGLVIRGLRGERTILDDQLVGGAVTMSVDEVTTMDLEVSVSGPRGGNGYVELINTLASETPVDWFDLQLVVGGIEWKPDGELLRFVAHCRAAVAEKLRSTDNQAELSWSNYSPTEVMQERAGQAGARFVGAGSNKRDTIVRRGRTDEGQPAETDYELGQRLAKEEGYWFFEAAGVVYFAPPSWLAQRMPRFRVSYGAGTDAPSDGGTLGTGVLGEPQCESTSVRDLQPGMPPRTVTLELPRWRSDQVRPGMVCDFDGLPGFPGAYVVTNISWPQDGGIAPGKCTMTDPTDPVPDPPEGDSADGTATGGSSSGSPIGKSKSALDMVTVALRQVGDKYVYGAEAAASDPDPSAFDCSELIQWACSQVGVSFADGSSNQIAAIRSSGLERSVAACARVRGALLWREGHVAISLGDGKTTVEARGRAYGVTEATIGTRFTRGGLIPGLIYPAGS